MPFEEDNDDPSVWFLDHNYVENMNDMFKKVNAREKLIGWYHSGPKLRASDLEINELFKRYTPNPLLVIIDVQPKESGVPTDAYFAVEEIKDVGTCSVSIWTRWADKAYCRTAQLQRKPLYTHHPLSRRKKPKRLVSSTFSEISVMSPSAPYRLVSQISCSHYKDYTYVCAKSRHTCRKYRTSNYQ